MEKLEQNLEPHRNGGLKEKLALMEAALYVSGRPLALKLLGSIVGSKSRKKVLDLAKMLVRKYSEDDGALELVELDDDRFVLQLKSKYVPFVKKLAMRPLLTAGPLRTLAYIAFRQPISQSEVADVRGSQAYNHIKDLDAMGLILAEKSGRTKILRTSDVFTDYFNLSRDIRIMKRQLSDFFDSSNKQK